ncbi:hypothetical protein VJI72_01230 [Parvimonas micra]|uniref:hypothetical protein n=1 Tax=Parvimonas micra TaxID=33033 RepID=UPI002B463881|nr:hypothetical protein [Parvimonas micra]MEB3028413.1 hypothetical protein [Parvimonas micra]
MKKFFKSLIFFTFLILLVGCSSVKTKTFEEKKSTTKGNILKIVCHYNEKENKILKMEVEDSKGTDLTEKERKEIDREAKALYGSYKGIEAVTDYKNNELIMTVKIDFEKFDWNNAEMYYSIIGGLDFIDADENIENGKKVYVVNAEKIFKKLREKGLIEK